METLTVSETVANFSNSENLVDFSLSFIIIELSVAPGHMQIIFTPDISENSFPISEREKPTSACLVEA
jgi:hypothetical protein